MKTTLMEMKKQELVDLICAYDKYIVDNYDEMQGGDWVPVCLLEFYNNDYESYKE